MSSPLLTITRTLIRAINAKEIDKISTFLHPDFHHRIFPVSIRPPGTPEGGSDKEMWLVRAREFMGMVETLGLDIEHPVNVVEAENSIVLQLNSDGKLKNGNVLKLEYVYIFKFQDEKVVELDEFVDSAGAMKAFAPA